MLGNDKNSKLINLLLLLNHTNLVFNWGEKLLEFLTNIDGLIAKLPQDVATKLKNYDRSVIKKDLVWAEVDGHHIITIDDNNYPAQLREIPNPPLVLFVIGDVSFSNPSN